MAEASDQTGSSPAGSATVMVIDPDVLARMVIAEYLRGCGYKVIEGIAAEDVFTVLGSGATIDVVFAEVRLRRNAAYGGAAASITAAKRQRILRAARHYLSGRPEPACRFDVVLLDALAADRIEWIKDAFGE